jgi:hypothetical protein
MARLDNKGRTERNTEIAQSLISNGARLTRGRIWFTAEDAKPMSESINMISGEIVSRGPIAAKDQQRK